MDVVIDDTPDTVIISCFDPVRREVARLALERLRGALEQAGATPGGVACARYYSLYPGISSQVRKLRVEFFDAARPPAGELLMWEGLSSMDAGFAVDAVAAKDGR